MSKRQQLCLVGILIPLIHVSGLPHFWRGIVFVILGIFLIAFAYRNQIEAVVETEDFDLSSTTDSFEQTTMAQEISHDGTL